MSRIITILGLIVAVTAQAAPPLAVAHPKVAFWLTFAGLVAAACGRELVSHDAVKRFMGSSLSLLLIVTVLTSTLMGCGGAPSRETLLKLAAGGERVSSVLEANESLPDQFLDQKIITPDIHKKLKESWRHARESAAAYNEGMRAVLQSAKPDLRAMVQIVARLITRMRALRILNNEAWNKVLSGIEVGLSVVASYFAVKIAHVREAGRKLRLSDRAICRYVGVPYRPADFQVIESYVPIAGMQAE